MTSSQKYRPTEKALSGLYEAIKTGTWREKFSTQKCILCAQNELLEFDKCKCEEGQPFLHYLSRIRFKNVDISELNEYVKFWVDNGYDINKQTDQYIAQKRASLGFTALLAAAEQSNIIFMEVLVKNGADINVRDSNGFSACHWAVLVGDMNCLLKLIELGADLKSTSRELEGKGVHPLLHTAVDEGRTEIVFYLLGKGLVEVNEEAIYKNVLSEKSFTHFPSRYKCMGTGDHLSSNNSKSLEKVDMCFTPLARAVRMRKIPIIEVLLKHSATLSEFSELHFCIVEGDTEVACILKDRFSDEGLRNDKIGNISALHCLHSIAFQDEGRIGKTKELIQDYIDAGWNVNSLSHGNTRKLKLVGRFSIPPTFVVSLSGCSLMHLACMFKSQPIIECLVEEGADINIKASSEGDAELYPLQISLLLEDWSSCIFLIKHGADTQAEGCLNVNHLTNPPSVHVEEMYNSLELLLKLGEEGSEPVLDAMLSKGVRWNGARELHISLEGGNPLLIMKVMENVGQSITMDELTWTRLQINGIEILVPSLVLVMIVCNKYRSLDFNAMAALIKMFAVHGYDCNATIMENDTSSEIFTKDPLIFLILGIDFKHRSNLLKAVLEFEHLQLNVRNSEGLTPVDWVLEKWNEQCSNGVYCWKKKDEDDGSSHCSKIVKMLVSHGADVSQLVLGENFKYHFGYKELIQVLFCAGAKVCPEFFASPVCHLGYVAARPFHKEVEELKKWVDEKKDRLHINLQFLARLKIRKMLGKIESLGALNDLPKTLKDQLLCTDACI